MMPDPDDPIMLERLPVTETLLRELGVDVEGVGTAHPIEDLRRYPVLSEDGWFLVIRNQSTLEEIHRCPWRLLGPVQLMSQLLDPR